jgi:hypothetical protein
LREREREREREELGWFCFVGSFILAGGVGRCFWVQGSSGVGRGVLWGVGVARGAMKRRRRNRKRKCENKMKLLLLLLEEH